jgi:Streptomyces sporulation and cell division protein, SsgA
MTATTIHHEHVAALHTDAGTHTPVTARWTYRADEPFALTIAFATERGRWVEWIFARDLLITGLNRASGEGDLSIEPTGNHTLLLHIHSPSGSATIELDRDDTEEFLAHTLELIPAGTESTHFDIDRLLADLTIN